MSLQLFQNSLVVGVGATALSAILGLLVAVALLAMNSTLRKWALGLVTLALLIPPFVATNCWLDYFGLTGRWRHLLPVDIYSRGGVIWLMTQSYWPICCLAALASWQKLQAAQIEIDLHCRGWRVIWFILLPAARSNLCFAALIVMVMALNNFAIPAILQVKVFSSEMWIRFNTQLDLPGALMASLPLLVLPIALLALIRHRTSPWPRFQHALPVGIIRRQLGNGWVVGTSALLGLLSISAVILPASQLLGSARTWSEFSSLFRAGSTLISNSMVSASGSAVVTLLLGLALARWRGCFLLWVTFLFPGVLLSIGLLMLFNRAPLDLIMNGMGIVLIALTVRFIGLAWAGAREARAMLDRDLLDTALLNGAGLWDRFRNVHWPQSGPIWAATAYLIYLLALWEVETLSLILPPGGETLPLRVFNLLHYGHNAQVNAICVTVLALGIAPVLAWIAWGTVKSQWEKAR